MDAFKSGLCREVVFVQKYIWLGLIQKRFWSAVFVHSGLCSQVSLYTESRPPEQRLTSKTWCYTIYLKWDCWAFIQSPCFSSRQKCLTCSESIFTSAQQSWEEVYYSPWHWCQQRCLLTDWLTDWLSVCLTDWLTDCLTEQLIDWLTNWLTNWLTDWPTGWLIDWLTNQVTDWLTDQLIDWLTDWLTDQPIDWLTDWSTDWPTDWLASNNWLVHGNITCLNCEGAPPPLPPPSH